MRVNGIGPGVAGGWIFVRDAVKKRLPEGAPVPAAASATVPVFGDDAKLQHDPHFRDHLLFYEYFHGDSGRGVGASHQTGWTGLIAKLLQPRR